MPIIRMGLAALALCAISDGAHADITFCNQTSYKLIYVAVAYPQSDGSFLSRGWLGIDNGKCDTFDTAIHVPTLFFRAESEWTRHGRRKTREIWGKGQSFAIWDNDNFQYYNAQQRVLRSSLAEFTQVGEAANGDLAATITFTDEGSSVSLKTSGEPAAQQTPAPAPHSQPDSGPTVMPTPGPVTPPTSGETAVDPDRLNDRQR